MRPSFESLYLRFAQLISERSTCARLQVGCVIVTGDFRQVVGHGYNGNARGLANTCDSTTPGACGCLHAEANAVTHCAASGPVEKIVFCTDLPCKMCAKMLVNLGGVSRVYFGRTYRLLEGREILQTCGIRVEQLEVS